MTQKSAAPGIEIPQQFQSDLGVQIARQKYFALSEVIYTLPFGRPVPARGTYRHRHDTLGTGCDGRSSLNGEWFCCGRQSRVVMALPNKNNAIHCLTAKTRALNHFAFFPPLLTVSAIGLRHRGKSPLGAPNGTVG